MIDASHKFSVNTCSPSLGESLRFFFFGNRRLLQRFSVQQGLLLSRGKFPVAKSSKKSHMNTSIDFFSCCRGKVWAIEGTIEGSNLHYPKPLKQIR